MQIRNRKQTVLLVGVLSFLIALFCVVWIFARPKATVGEKTISTTVTHKDGTVNEYSIETKEEFLRGALEQENLIAGENGDYGLYLMTVDGETADESNEEWWCITKNGAMTEYGVDDQPINDGDRFEITLNVGW